MSQQTQHGFKLSPQQKHIWKLLTGRHLRSPFHNRGILEVSGITDIAALGAMFLKVIDAHEILRTRFIQPGGGGEALQIVEAGAQASLAGADDWRGLSSDERNRSIEEFLSGELSPPIDATYPAISIKAAQTASDRWLALVTMSPLCGDLRSLVNLASFLIAAPGPRGTEASMEPLQYADLADWMLSIEEKSDEKEEAFWQEQLALAATAPVRPAAVPFTPRLVRWPFPDFLRGENATHQTAVFAVWAYLLWRRYQEREGPVALAVHADGRSPEVRQSLGVFEKHLPAVARINPSATFASLQEEAGRLWRNALLHEPGLRVQALDGARWPWGFGISDRSAIASNGGVRISVLLDSAVTSEFDLALNCVRRPAGWNLELGYNSELFSEREAEKILGAIPAALERFSADPSLRLSDGPSMGKSEFAATVALASGDKSKLSDPVSLHWNIVRQARRTPSAIAVEFEGRRLTYSELDSASGRIGNSLLEKGAGPERIVAVWGERSLELPAALLGILKAGAAFLALDPELPTDRLRAIIEDANPILLLAPRPRMNGLPPMPRAFTPYDLDCVDAAGSTEEITGEMALLPDNLAYVIYTSGSTGQPKGVLISHRAIVNQMEWIQREWPITTADNMLLKTSCGFDPFVWEVFWPLLHGGRVVIAAPTGHRDSDYLCRLIASRRVSSTYFVPSMLMSLLENPAVREVISFGWILAGGEAVPLDVIRKFHETVAGEFLHLYGPAEASIAVLGCVIPRGYAGSFPPLGKPVSNSQVYLVDEFLQLVPDGATGEICIGGLALGRGYLNLPIRTALSFVPDPFTSEIGARMYRTGDLARRHADRNIEFVGRADSQVKIHGCRMELSDIEFHLNALPSVREGAVIVQQDGAGRKRLVACVVNRNGSGDRTAVRRDLQARLPTHMVPAEIVFLEQMPHNVNGKLDRNRLREMAVAVESEIETTQHISPAERLLIGIWRDTLRVPEVKRESDFFMLGGHSLLATQVAARIERELGVTIPLRLMLDLTTISLFAPALEFLVAASILNWPRANVEDALNAYAADPDGNTIRIAEIVKVAHAVHERIERAVAGKSVGRIRRLGKQTARLSLAQRRMWFLDRLSPGTALFNVPMAIRFSGDLQPELMAGALRQLVERHEALRTTFFEQRGEPLQQIQAAQDVTVEVIDCVDAEALERRVRTESWRPFDLESAPPLRAAVLRCAAADSILLLTLHHIVCDDWSMAVLTRDLLAFYRGEGASLPPLEIQFSDFAEWDQEQACVPERAAQLAWWREYLRALPGQLPLPVQGDSRRSPENSGGLHTISLPSELVSRLNELRGKGRATPYMVLLAAFNAFLYCLTGACDIVVGSPFANREDEETGPLIGLLLNSLPVRTRLRPDYSFDRLLETVRQSVLAVQDHRHTPLEAILTSLDDPRSRNPFRVWLSVQNAPVPDLQLPGIHMEALLLEPGATKFDLSLLISQQSYTGYFEYRKDLFAGNIEILAGFWLWILGKVAVIPSVRLSELRHAWLELEAEHGRRRMETALADFRSAASRKFARVRDAAREDSSGGTA